MRSFVKYSLNFIFASVFLCAFLLIGGRLSAQTAVISFDGPAGNANFNDLFKEPNSSDAAAKWIDVNGGLNVAGQVSATTGQTGFVIYDTSVTPGTGGNPGTSGTFADMFTSGTFMLSFSLQNYQTNDADQVGIFFRTGTGGAGYVLVVNPGTFGTGYGFQYRLFSTSNWATQTDLSSPPISGTLIPTPASPYYTLGLTVNSGTTYTAQIYDATGASVGGTATFNDSTFTSPGVVGFREWNGASVYQFAIATGTGASVALNPPSTLYVAVGGTGNGTYANPFGRISTAVTSATTPGTVVAVESGTYRGEAISFPKSGSIVSGTLVQPIILQGTSSNPASVVVPGTQVFNTSWSLSGTAGGNAYYVSTGTCPYYFGAWITGTADTYGDARDEARNQLFVTSSSGSPVQRNLHRGNWISHRSLWLGDRHLCGSIRHGNLRRPFYIIGTVPGGLVYLQLPNGADPTGDTIELASTQGPLLTTNTQSGIIIQNMTFTQGANAQQSNGLVQIGKANSGGMLCQMDNCAITYASGAGLAVYSQHRMSSFRIAVSTGTVRRGLRPDP